MSDSNGIVAKDEIIRILKRAEGSNPEITANLFLSDLEITQVVGTRLVLALKKRSNVVAPLASAVSSLELALGATIEVIFSMTDGQYAIRDEVHELTATTFSVDAGHSLIRLQRRQDFRVSVKHETMKFLWSARRDQVSVPFALEILDLSAGGLRLLWPPHAGAPPAKGEGLSGRLILRAGPPEEAIEANIIFIKDHGPDAPLKPDIGDALSFKFESLSQVDARTLIFTCVGVARSIYGSR